MSYSMKVMGISFLCTVFLLLHTWRSLERYNWQKIPPEKPKWNLQSMMTKISAPRSRSLDVGVNHMHGRDF